MSGDLISRKKAIFFISDVLDRFGVNVGDKMANALINSLESQPTAFDLESAIAEIREYADNVAELGGNFLPQVVIEILKSAANATNGKNGG